MPQVTSAPVDRPKSETEEGGLAGALMKALKAREAALRPGTEFKLFGISLVLILQF